VEKPAPVTLPELTVTAAVPVDVKVTDFDTAVFKATLPNETEEALTASVGTAAFNCRAKLLEIPPALAVMVTDFAVDTAETDAVNPALVALAGTVTDAGTLIALSLLERLTVNPVPGAAELSPTVQLSVPEPVIDAFVQETALKVGGAATPLPLRLTDAVGLEDELLEIANCPVTPPVAFGAN
jgi:hypothetical protein